MRYIKLDTKNTTDPYRLKVYDAIRTFYTDLADAKKPEKTECKEEHCPVYLWPITFGYPETKIVPLVPPKSQPFSSIIPGDIRTYKYTFADEDEYLKDMGRSLFCLTYRKGA
jgi:hypothetical protein